MKEKNMNVYELQERILELSHDEVPHDTNLRAKSLRWLNSAYHEFVEVLMPFLGDSLNEDITADTSDSIAILPKKAQKVLRVENAKTGSEIPHKSSEKINTNERMVSFRLTVDGLAFSGTLIPESVRIIYVPQVLDLEEDDTEDSILIPVQYHTTLIWGALVWASVFERGFTSQRELSLYQAKWEDAKRNSKLSLASRSSGRFNVDEFNLI
jgi:hypothetical protein